MSECPRAQALAALEAPRCYVVRRVDYLQYRDERIHYFLRFVASCVVVAWLHGAEAAAGIARFVAAATAMVWAMEAGLQLSGQRKMKLDAYAGRRLGALSSLLALGDLRRGHQTLGRVDAAAATSGASANHPGRSRGGEPRNAGYQSFFEGGVYFGNFYAFGVLCVHGDTGWLGAGAAAWIAFPAWSFARGRAEVEAYLLGSGRLAAPPTFRLVPRRRTAGPSRASTARTSCRGARFFPRSRAARNQGLNGNFYGEGVLD